MPKIPQEKIDEIRQSVDIVDVIGQYVPLTRKGSNYRGLCPFHDDNDPSLTVSPRRQIYRCFACGQGGNVFTFLQEYLHIPFMEALKQVAELGGVDVRAYDLSSRVETINVKLKPYYDMHEEAEKIYAYYLNTKPATLARDYLAQRGFNEEIIETFKIGYAPAKSILFDAFTRLNYQEIDMVKSGLVLESRTHQDRFVDRIMFPIEDESGRVIGFSGRIYRQGAQEAKYVNSPESEIFIKGRTLYNYHRCKEAVKKEGFVYINEGFMDVIAMYRASHPNAIALMGTALTNAHMTMLKRLTRHVVLCLDGDAAGENATMKSASILGEHGFIVEIIRLPDGHDPDEIYSSQGKGALDALLKQRMSPVEFMMDYQSRRYDLNNYQDRKTFMLALCGEIAKVDDEIDRQNYIEQLSKLSGFSETIIKGQLQAQTHVDLTKIDVVKKVKDVRKLLDKYETAERSLLFYMLSSKEVSHLYETKIGFMYNDTYRILASYIVDYYRTHSVMNVADLINRLSRSQPLVNTLTEISELSLPVPYDQQAVNDYIATIAANAKRLKKEQLKEQFTYVLDPVQKSEILKQIIELEKEEQ